MLVCPGCREENLEEARFCRVCGRSLEPVASFARREERPEDDAELELPGPSRARPWLAAATLLLVAVGVAGWGVFATTRPDPCRGRFSSALFPYCMRVPQGWSGGIDVEGTDPIDRYILSSGGPTSEAVTDVRVEDVIDPTVQTAQYAQQFRVSQEADGIDPSTPEGVMLDGEQGVAWNYSLEGGEAEEPPLQVREVMLVRPEGAWRITLVAVDDVYLDARVAFERMLETWRWKS